MTVIAPLPERAVLGEMRIQPFATDIVQMGSLGKFPQVVHQGSESNAAGAVEKSVFVVHFVVLMKA